MKEIVLLSSQRVRSLAIRSLLLAAVLNSSLCPSPFARAATFAVPEAGQTAAQFVPKGFHIEDRCEGDLNGDKTNDLALQLINGSADNGSNAKRLLVVLLKEADGSYKRGAVGDQVLLGTSEAGAKGAPPEMAIKGGILTIDETGGGFDDWGVTLKFRLNQKSGNFDLIGFDYSDTETNDDKFPGSEISINLLTKDRIDKKTLDSGNQVTNTKKSKTSLRVPTIENFNWNWVEEAERPPGKKAGR